MSEKAQEKLSNKTKGKPNKTKQRKQSDYDYYSDYSDYYYSEYSDYSDNSKRKQVVKASRPIKTPKSPTKNISAENKTNNEIKNKISEQTMSRDGLQKQEENSMHESVNKNKENENVDQLKVEENPRTSHNITGEEQANQKIAEKNEKDTNELNDEKKDNTNDIQQLAVADGPKENTEVLPEEKKILEMNVEKQQNIQPQSTLVIEQALNIQQPLQESEENETNCHTEIVIQIREPEPKLKPSEPEQSTMESKNSVPSIRRRTRNSNASLNKEFKPEPPQRPSSSRRSKSSKKTHQIPMPQRLIPIRTKALKQKHISGLKDTDWDAVIYYMEVERAQCLEECDYELSVQLSNAINFTLACKETERKENDRETAIKEAKERQQNIDEEIEKFNEETKALEKELIENRENERQKLQENHKYSLDALDEEWASPNKIRMFNHPSGRLLSMRKQLFHLVSQNRYEEASKLKKFVDEEQRNEEARSIETMQNAYDQAVIKLLTKNARELKEFDAQTAINISKLKEHRTIEKRPLVIRQRQAKEKIEQLSSPEARNAARAYGSIRKQRRNMFLSREKPKESRPKETVFDVEAVPLLYLPKVSRRVNERSAIRMVKAQT